MRIGQHRFTNGLQCLLGDELEASRLGVGVGLNMMILLWVVNLSERLDSNGQICTQTFQLTAFAATEAVMGFAKFKSTHTV